MGQFLNLEIMTYKDFRFKKDYIIDGVKYQLLGTDYSGSFPSTIYGVTLFNEQERKLLTVKELENMSLRGDILEAMHEQRKNVSTRCLEAVIYPNGKIKLIIYANIQKSGWIKRELRKSCYGVDAKEFTFDYIKSEVDNIYNRFSDTEIHELLNKI